MPISSLARACFRHGPVILLAAILAACAGGRAVAQTTVTYTQQVGNLAATFGDGGGSFNDGGTRFGMFANFSAKQAAAWRDLKTAGDNTGSARSLQVGDRFTIGLDATSAFGLIGFSLNDNGTQGGSFANRNSGSRLFVQAAGTGGVWEVNSASGAGGYTSLGFNASSIRRTYTFEVTMTSESTANVAMIVDSGTYRAFNLTLNGSAGANIDAFSMALSDDWNGSSNQNIYWQQETSVESTGVVELGYFLASPSAFTPGRVTDGLAANSTSTTQANAVFIGGDAGSQVNLNQNNTYTGATTINANATGEAQHANALGSTAAGTTVSNNGTLKLYSATGISFAAEALTLNGLGVGGSNGALRLVGGTSAWNGAITLASSSRINADATGGAGSLTIAGNVSGGANVLFLGANGAPITVSGTISGAGGSQDGTTTSVFKDGASTLTFSGSNTYTGDTRITSGTLTVAAGGNLGNGSDVFVSSGGVLNLATSVTVASLREAGTGNGGTAVIGSGAVLTIDGNGFNVFQNSISGAGSLAIAGSTGTTNLYGTQSYAGTTSVSAGRLATSGSMSTSAIDVSGGSFATNVANLLPDVVPVLLSGAGVFGIGGNETIGSLAGTGGTAALGANTLTLATNDAKTYAGALTGSGTLAKGGSGLLELSGASGAFTGVIDVLAGSLDVTGSHALSRLNVAAGAELGGFGYVGGNLSGSGLIAPGTSPGILTIEGAMTPSASMAFAFEFTGTGSPNWASASSSVNDVLRLEAADPFTAALVTTNTVGVYFDVGTLASWQTFDGGFFVDDPSQVANLLQPEVANGTFRFYVRGDGGGATTYNGVSYYTMDQFIAANPGLGITGVSWSTVSVATANFADETVTGGEVTQFTIVPEPSALTLLGCGLGGLALLRLRRNRPPGTGRGPSKRTFHGFGHVWHAVCKSGFRNRRACASTGSSGSAGPTPAQRPPADENTVKARAQSVFRGPYTAQNDAPRRRRNPSKG